MIQISKFLYRISSGRVALISLIFFAAFIVTVLPAQAEKAEAYSKGAGSPDTSQTYSASELYQMAEKYGVDGRAAYIRARFTFDLVFPIVYLLFLGTSISWCLSIIVSEKSRFRLLNLFPVAGWSFDMFENLSASVVFQRFPQHTPILENLAGIFTLIKWVFVYGSFVILIPAFFVAFWILIRTGLKRE